MINASTVARIALFTRKPKEDDVEGKEYPLMYGAVEADGSNGFKIGVSAFKRVNGQGKSFLSLSISNEGDTQVFGGMLFKDEKKGKEGHYFGFINETYVDIDGEGKKVYSSSDWQLSINAKVTEAAPGSLVKKYISGKVRPSNRAPAPATAQDVQDEELPF